MQHNYGEPPPEMGDEFESEVSEENLEGIIIIEIAKAPELEGLIVEKVPEYVPPDKYLEEHLERERQEKLNGMIPKRIP